MRKSVLTSSGSLTHQGSGFTLIELMIVISVLAVILSMALPSFRDFTLQQRIKNAGFDTVATLTFARSEAIKQNGNVTITPTGGNWSNGWTIAGIDGEVIKTQSGFEGLRMNGPASIVFQRSGRTTSGGITIDDNQSNSKAVPRCISFDTTGLPKSREGVCT